MYLGYHIVNIKKEPLQSKVITVPRLYEKNKSH